MFLGVCCPRCSSEDLANVHKHKKYRDYAREHDIHMFKCRTCEYRFIKRLKKRSVCNEIRPDS